MSKGMTEIQIKWNLTFIDKTSGQVSFQYLGLNSWKSYLLI